MNIQQQKNLLPISAISVAMRFQGFRSVVTKLRPAKIFYPARGALFKKVYTHFEPQLDRIISGTPQFQMFILFFSLENTPKFWEKNRKIRDRIEVKTFFFFRDHYKFGRKIAKLEIDLKQRPFTILGEK